VVTVGLVGYAAVRRAGLRRGRFVWSMFALMVAFSLGTSWRVGGWEFSLPSAWLWRVYPAMRLTRDPSRFNMFAAVLAGVLASAGLKHLLGSFRGRWARAAVVAGLSAVAVTDLGIVILPRTPLPALPGCYAFLKRHDPNGAVLELPDTFAGTPLGSLCTYRQSHHRLTTSAGYSGHDNVEQFQRVHMSLPFIGLHLADPGHASVGPVAGVDLRDYLWLYLTVNRFDYVVLHQPKWEPPHPSPPEQLDRFRGLLRDCAVYEDADSVVYARSRLRPPSRPVPNVMAWGVPNFAGDRLSCVLPVDARVAVYNPDAGRAFRLSLDLGTASAPLTVRLRAGPDELARWEVAPGGYRTVTTPELRLPAGVQYLTIERETIPKANGRLTRRRQSPDRPQGLRLARLAVQPEPVAGRDDPPIPAVETRVR
jgi:hypothetical protein